MEHAELEIRPRQGDALEETEGEGELGGRAAKEFEPRRRIEKEVLRLHRRPSFPGDFQTRFDAAPRPSEKRAHRASPRAGAYLEAAHRADGGEGLSAEAEGADGVQVSLVGDLRSRVALEGEVQVLAGHPYAVVGDADELTPGVLELHGDGARAGVEGVFHQLFDHGSRPLYDLARGDLVDEQIGQEPDRAHG